MKNFKQHYLILLIIAFSVLFLNSCKKNDEPGNKYNYFISSEYKLAITSEAAKVKLTAFPLISPESSIFGTKANSDVEVNKITYKTTFKNNNIQASGLICMPKTAGDYPILCFQNGTNTEHRLAPTENPQNEMFMMMESVASMGFIVVMPDYIGFGASSQLAHPYLHAESTTQSILDLLRAVKELGTDAKIIAKPTKNLFIFGYSQGGWATMQLQKTIEKDYSSEFSLVASSCAAGPYSLEYMSDFITGKTDYPMPYFLAYLLNAYQKTGLIANPLSDFIQEPYASKIPGLFDGMHSGDAINSQLTTKMATLLTPEYRTGFATSTKFSNFKSALKANSIEAWSISTPTRLYHAANDEYIPVSLSQKMYADFKTKGVLDNKIELKIIDGYDHPFGVIPVGLSTILWFMELKK
ncbi:MAG: lipase family protein [Bacteroidota bacterium]|nr:lipase family protein [Bacteroidota bacterium]